MQGDYTDTVNMLVEPEEVNTVHRTQWSVWRKIRDNDDQHRWPADLVQFPSTSSRYPATAVRRADVEESSCLSSSRCHRGFGSDMCPAWSAGAFGSPCLCSLPLWTVRRKRRWMRNDCENWKIWKIEKVWKLRMKSENQKREHWGCSTFSKNLDHYDHYESSGSGLL